MIDIPLALLAGALTVAAPCVLPMLPILLGASIGQAGRARPVFIALGFVLAFSGFAMLFSLFPDILGLSQDVLRDVAIVLLLAFGLLMLWRRPFDLLAARLGGLVDRADRIGRRAGAGNAGGFVLGMTLGAVWTPCAGPVLGTILTLVATAEEPGRAAPLLISYAAGAAVPMLAIAYGGQLASSRVRRIARHAHRLQQAFGVLVVLTAIAMFFQYDTLITVWLSALLPDASSGF